MNLNKLSEQLLEWIKECENAAEEYIQEIGDSSEGDRKLAEAAAYRNVYDYLTKVKGQNSSKEITKKIFRQYIVGVICSNNFTMEQATKAVNQATEIMDFAEQYHIFNPCLKEK